MTEGPGLYTNRSSLLPFYPTQQRGLVSILQGLLYCHSTLHDTGAYLSIYLSIYLYLASSNDLTKIKSKGTLLTEDFVHPSAGAMQSTQVEPDHLSSTFLMVLILLSLHLGA